MKKANEVSSHGKAFITTARAIGCDEDAIKVRLKTLVVATAAKPKEPKPKKAAKKAK